jgi:molybdenum-dependent DNA-binding transcriptional regulator ModE
VQAVQLLIGVNNHDSIAEMSEKTGLSLAGVHGKLEELQGVRLQLVNPPRKPGAARDRTLTDLGRKYLEENGHLPKTRPFEPRIFDT